MINIKSYFKVGVLLIFLVAQLFVIVNPAKAAGASLYITPSTGTYVIGGKFSVSLKVNSGGQAINTAEGAVSYDTSIIEAVAISSGGSIFNLWITQPNYSNGVISFGGGIPMPGYNGTAGHICTVTFVTKKAGDAQIRFTSGAVLANDGKGTNILASMGSGSYKVSPKVDAPKTDDKDATVDKPVVIEKLKEVEKEYNKPEIKSSTHSDPNKWFNKNTIKFNWDLPSTVTGVSYAFDDKPSSDPGPKSDGLFSEKEFPKIDDGIWYLHLKFKDSSRWGTISHYRVMIDSLPPQPLEVSVDQGSPEDWPILRFQTEDSESGLWRYEIFIGSLESREYKLEADQKELQVSGLEVGPHKAMIIAYDNAGNERSATLDFEIKPIDAPVITNYPREIKTSDQLFVSGTALEDVMIIIYLEDKKGVFATSSVQSDILGNWTFIYNKESLKDGKYVIWAEAVNKKGIQSVSSNKAVFMISPPVFAVVGEVVINYFTVFVSLIFMIVFIIFIIVLIVSLLRRKLKKETIEAEHVLVDSFEAVKRIMDDEFDELKKFEGKKNYKAEKQKTIEVIKKKVDNLEKKSLKEIQDVEDILK